MTPELEAFIVGASMIINLFSLFTIVLTMIGLYMLSDKLGEDHSWLAFIPFLNIYTLGKVSGKGLFGIIIGLVVRSVIGGLILFISTAAMGVLGIAGASIPLFVALLPVLYFSILFWIPFFIFKGIAENTGNGTGTAILMLLFPWIMFIVVAKQL